MTRTHANLAEAVEHAGPANMNERQEPLRALYLTDGEQARIVDHARTTMKTAPATMPLYGEVILGENNTVNLPVGVHKAVGGDSDFPTPGDILCGALAACLDSVIRIISNKLGLRIKTLDVSVTAMIDVRGTLRVDDDVPVGFQNMDVNVVLEMEQDIPAVTMDAILKAAEHSCVILQTLRNQPEITILRLSLERADNQSLQASAA